MIAGSIVLKVGIILIGVSLISAIGFYISSYVTKQMMGTNSAITVVGAQRARVYKIASLLQQLHGSAVTPQERTSILHEIDQWKRALESLEFMPQVMQPLKDVTPEVNQRLGEMQSLWSTQLKPTLELAIATSGEEGLQATEAYMRQADVFVEVLSDTVDSVDQSREDRIETLFHLQLLLISIMFFSTVMAIVLLTRVIRIPMNKLIEGADRFAEGQLATMIPIATRDEFGQLARKFERLASTIRQKIQEMEALHDTGQEISMLGKGGLDDVLRAIVDRAASLVKTDLALLMVRHKGFHYWVVEAASGSSFDVIRKEILLLQETPFSNQAYDSREPVVVLNLDDYANQPVRFRDEFGAKSFMAVPLLRPDDCIGVLVMMSTTGVQTFSEFDIRLAQQFASYASVALDNAQLLAAVTSEAQKLSEKLKTIQENMVALTHEVKAPAGRMAEFASWMIQDYRNQLDEKGLRYLEWIQREGLDLAHLAERAIGMARISEEPTVVESVALGQIVEDVLGFLEKEIQAKGVQIRPERDLPVLACRPIHVKQILVNLLSNALKFMGDQTHPMIQIGTVTKENVRYIFIQDNGIGMSQDELGRIFQPFYRVGTSDIPGAGMGLTIVKTIVEYYGGQVQVESQPGTGSTFLFQLPVLAGNSQSRLMPIHTSLSA